LGDALSEDGSDELPTADEIVSALGRTGYILEHQVTQVLRSAGFSDVDINYTFPDAQTEKSREIDVRVAVEHRIKRPPVDLTVRVELIVECKNSQNPFVLIGEERPKYGNYVYYAGYWSFDPLGFGFPKYRLASANLELELGRLPESALRSSFYGNQLVRMNRHGGAWRADNSSVHDSILYPLAKAVKYVQDMDLYDEDEDVDPPWEAPWITYTFPMMVSSGSVFTASVTSESVDVEQVGWATLSRSFSAQDVPHQLYVDIVSFDFLESYLRSRILLFLEGARQKLAENVHLFDPEWLLSNAGAPRNLDGFNRWLGGVRSRRKA
jgi:hypothetical protein